MAAHFRKFIAPFIRTRRVDDRARTVADFVARDARVERATPGAPENIDGLRRIGAAAEHSQDLFGIRDIHIIVNDNHVPAEIGAGAALARDHAGLTRMTWIALLDRNHS